ncbi:MAG: hypothetical protein BroJett003_07480 [Planctomycetota bacterium]|nr:MAG: hypothetical protein BroJett003_07480 [Planctomycetota bacterium]
MAGGHANVVTGLAYSPDGALIASANADNTIKIWLADAEPREALVTTLAGHIGPVNCVAFSPTEPCSRPGDRTTPPASGASVTENSCTP